MALGSIIGINTSKLNNSNLNNSEELTLSSYFDIIDKNETITFTVTTSSDDQIYAISSDTNIAIATVNNKTVSVTGIASGNVIIIVQQENTSSIKKFLCIVSPSISTSDVFIGATSLAGGASGLVLAPAAGDENKFLRGDGTWALPNVEGNSSSEQIVLSTTPSTINGAMWYEIDTNGAPSLRIRYGSKIYIYEASQHSTAEPSAAVEPPIAPVPQTGYELYNSSDNVISFIPEDEVTYCSIDDVSELTDEDQDTFLATFEDVKAIDYMVVQYFYWFDIPERYKTQNFAWLKYEFTCYGENVEVWVNGNPMDVSYVDGNTYYARLTEFGAVVILTD